MKHNIIRYTLCITDMYPSLTMYLKQFRNFAKVENISAVTSEDRFQNNKVEEDLQSIFKPFNFMMNLFLCAKYSVRGKCFTPNTRFYNWFRLICVIVNRCFNLRQFIIWHYTIKKTHFVFSYYYGHLCINIGSAIIYILYLTGDLIISVSTITQSDYNIFLVIKMQEVLKSLKINGSEIKGFLSFSWWSVIISNILSIGYIILYCFTLADMVSIVDVISAYASISYEIHVLYALLLLKLTNKMLTVWIKEFRNSRNLGDSTNEEYINRMFFIYWDVQDIYMTIEKTFHHTVRNSIYCFIWIVAVVQYIYIFQILFYIIFTISISLWEIFSSLVFKTAGHQSVSIKVTWLILSGIL
ncbi:hypothetical protein B5X24_HaOG200742 [Helicoverpa armigera]|uniref:Gustatory receptor n=1 Tax=Helicoverpa armigera TaxID=29058 RepID=A0A2W1BPX2_HELAM|nr:hypothetical protein B5X24_HaOG200742 [Helicoverpa armigera]